LTTTIVKSQLYTRLWRCNANINNSGSKLDKRSWLLYDCLHVEYRCI